ncbi:MAG: internal scaffolding protein [Microviridae sp.]|nr:MAG: internal scaffolding protein [Microviridae sp.]
MEFHSRYKPNKTRGTDISDDTRTSQEYLGEANINVLMSKYEQTGLMNAGRPVAPPAFQDVRHLQKDFHESMNTITRSREIFDQANARIRDRFQSPERLLAFLADGKNRAEAESLGLLEKRPTGQPGASADGGTPPAPPKTDKAP